MATEAYPLSWPAGWPRTSSYQRKVSKFQISSFAVVRDTLLKELKRFGAQNVILSTNIPLRKDGLPYSGFRAPDDVGVAIYFKLKNQNMVFACDKWSKIEDNIHAIAKTIDALRGIERWGSSDLLERAFTGFQALAAGPSAKPWHEVLGVARNANPYEIRERWLELLKTHHPDKGGDPAFAAQINRAYEESRNV